MQACQRLPPSLRIDHFVDVSAKGIINTNPVMPAVMNLRLQCRPAFRECRRICQPDPRHQVQCAVKKRNSPSIRRRLISNTAVSLRSGVMASVIRRNISVQCRIVCDGFNGIGPELVMQRVPDEQGQRTRQASKTPGLR